MNLTHWGQVSHISVSRLTIIGSDNGLSPGRRQAIIWTNAEILLIGPLGTNFNEILIETHIFSFKKMHLKMSAKWRPFCLRPNMLNSDICSGSVTTMLHARSYHNGPGNNVTWLLAMSHFFKLVSGLLCSGNDQFYPYSSGLLHWHWDNHTGAIIKLPQCKWSNLEWCGYCMMKSNACEWYGGNSVGNSSQFASLPPTTLEEERELFVDFSSILCSWEPTTFFIEFQTLGAKLLSSF